MFLSLSLTKSPTRRSWGLTTAHLQQFVFKLIPSTQGWNFLGSLTGNSSVSGQRELSWLFGKILCESHRVMEKLLPALELLLNIRNSPFFWEKMITLRRAKLGNNTEKTFCIQTQTHKTRPGTSQGLPCTFPALLPP